MTRRQKGAQHDGQSEADGGSGVKCVMPEVNLKWHDFTFASRLIGITLAGSCPMISNHTGEGWRSSNFTTGPYPDQASAKAAVIAELMRRNEAERIALEGL